jgi:PKD repeat protein
VVGVARTRGALGVAVIAALLLVLAAPARAAETTIGFDHFPGGSEAPAGTIAGSQWQAEGVTFGKAEEFGQPSVAGNCGKPTVRRETTTPAASPPNFAVLATCVAAFNTQGTFGALGAPARGSLSVEVRNLTSTPSVGVRLAGYDAGGAVVAEGHGEATSAGWQRIAATLTGAARISYFAIATEKVTSQEVAIDDLGFEAPPVVTETPAPPPSPSPAPPTASLALLTPNPAAGQPITLSGAGSTAGGGTIVSYGWNFRGGATEETSTGKDPQAEVTLGPGAHTVTLIVTNSKHEQATSHLDLVVPTTVKPHLPDGGEGECKPTLEIGDARMLAECIQTLGDGYVIEGQLAINGTLLIPRNGFLKIKTVTTLGVGTKTELYGAVVDVELANTPLGTMVLGERDLEAEPIPLEAHAYVPPKFEGVLHGLRGSAAAGSSGGSGGNGGGSPTPTGSATPKPAKQLLYVFGVGKNCKAGETTKAGCCPPPNGHIVCGEIPGNFPITGLVDVYLTSTGKTELYVQVGLNLKEVNLEATGALEIIVNNESGIELQSMKFEIGEAALKPIFKIKGASFQYYFPSYEEASKADTWQAKGTITFGEEVAQLKAEMAFKKGNFRSAAMSLKIKPGVPIFSGVFLNEIGASLGVEPLEFGGSLGANIAEVLELELEFRFREATENELGYFGGEGRLSYKESKIASLAADVYTDGYVDAALKIELKLPLESKSPVVEVRGGLSFWDEPNHQPEALWQVQGEAFVHIWIIEIEGVVLVNNEYVAGCAGVNGFGVEGDYEFKKGGVDGGLFAFSRCTDQLKKFKEQPAKKHTGGFVKEESERLPVRVSRRSGATAAAGGESESFTLPGDTQGQELRVNSTTGSPVLRITAPDGRSFTSPSSPKQIASVPGQFIAAIAPDPSQTLILLEHPKGGTWTIEALPGSGPLGKIETAEDVAPARVRVHVHKQRHGYALDYKIANHLPGTRVRFVERGRDSTHVLGTVSGASGTLRFVPAEALSRSRQIFAYLVNPEGVEIRELAVGRYSAPPPFRPRPPRSVRILRRRSSAIVEWSAVSGARTYRVTVRGSDGRLETHILKASVHSALIPTVLGFEKFTATVAAVGGKDMLSGRPARARLGAVKLRRAVVRHGRHRSKKR